MNKLLQAVLILILMLSSYHLVRDALQTAGINNKFTNIAHRHHEWCRSSCNIVTFPLDIAGIVIPVIVLKRNRFGMLGSALFCLMPLWIIFSSLS